MKEGRLIVVSGPSGTGKGTLIRAVRERLGDTEFSVSMTTREQRLGEEEGKDYYFVSKEQFEESIRQEGFLEWAEVYGNYYGTPREAVLERMKAGKDVILDIDVQGADKVKEAMPEALRIFILPPSMKELRRRLVARNTDLPEVIETRLEAAAGEIRKAKEYDYVLVNGALEEAIQAICAVFLAERQRVGEDIEEIIQRIEEEA